MVLPSRRWFLGAAGLASLALLALWWPEAGLLFVAADLGWLGALAVDFYRVSGFDWQVVEVAREAPPAFSVGRAMPVTYRWRHRLTHTLTLRVREEFPDPLIPVPGPERGVTIPPGQAIQEEVVLMPARRGKAGGGLLTLRVLGPWGLAWRQGRLELPWQATVYPNLVGASLRAFATQAQRRREAGFRSVRRIGEGRMFESLKEWVPGEDPRTIDWKATARRGKVMARHYEDERRQLVLLVLDAGRLLTAEVDGRPRLEAVIEAALHLAYSAVEHDDNIGLLVFADQIQQFVPPARGRRALRAVLDALAGVEGRLVEPNYPAAFAYLAARSRKRALTVFFTDVIDRTASEALVTQVGSLRPRPLPLAVTLRDPSLERLATRRPATVEAAFERAAAEELLLAREEALSDMRRRGVLVLDVPPAAASRAMGTRNGEQDT